MRAVVYCRISSDPKDKGLGVARQESDARALAESLGWTVTDVIVDNDKSAMAGLHPSVPKTFDGWTETVSMMSVEVDDVILEVERLLRKSPSA